MCSALSNHESRVMLTELLLAEKDATRGWLRAEMNRLVDPLLDSIFNRLQTKLTNGLERTQSGVDGNHEEEIIQGQLEPSLNQLYCPSFVIAQPSTSSSHPIQQQNVQNVHYSYQQPNDQIHSNENFIQQTFVQSKMSPNAHVNFEVLSKQPTTSHSSLNAQYLPPAISNDQSIVNLRGKYWKDEDEECDCDECVYGEIEVKEENDDDDDDDVQLIEDVQEDEESFRPVKKAKFDTTQPNNAQQQAIVEVVEPTEEAQPNQVNAHDKQYITVRLQCLEANCPETFEEHEFNDHLMDEHSIGPNRCWVKDCKRSFLNHHFLGEHIKQDHQGTSQWHCDKCPKHFTKYHQLSCHNREYHQLGHFECSFPSCTFTGEYKKKVFHHYTQQHKQTLACQHVGCNFQTPIPALLKRHIRTHSGVRPYRCKWPECDYAAAQKGQTIVHIRQHLAHNPTRSVSNGAQLDPNDYVEVMHELL